MSDFPPSTSSRAASLAVIAVGALLMTGSVLADTIGLSGGGSGFGWKQLIAAIAGLVILLAGTTWFLQPTLEGTSTHGESGDDSPS